MNCFFHEELSAVASCTSCNKALCKSCASKYNPCLCDECFNIETDLVKEEKNKLKKDALIDTHTELISAILKGVIFSVLFSFLLKSIDPKGFNLSFSIFFFFIPFGWRFITYVEQWLPSLFMSGIFFLIYIAMKFTLSLIIGIPCFIYQILKYIAKLILNTSKYK